VQNLASGFATKQYMWHLNKLLERLWWLSDPKFLLVRSNKLWELWATNFHIFNPWNNNPNCRTFFWHFIFWVRRGSPKPRQWLKSTDLEIQDGGRSPNFQHLNCDNSAAYCSILVKFGMWMRYGSGEVAKYCSPLAMKSKIRVRSQILQILHL